MILWQRNRPEFWICFITLIQYRAFTIITEISTPVGIGGSTVFSSFICNDKSYYCAEKVLNRISKTFNISPTGLKSMLQRYRKCFFQNHRCKGIESTIWPIVGCFGATAKLRLIPCPYSKDFEKNSYTYSESLKHTL